jgi:ppGpp synthetase/RelA/SpoT-type nucleotidyltranferase
MPPGRSISTRELRSHFTTSSDHSFTQTKACGDQFAAQPFYDYHSGPMEWTKPQYSGTRRTKAGIALAQDRETEEDLSVIDNWRSSHALPLQTIKMLLKIRAKSVDSSAVVAQRLKRLPSIRAKLKRETMRLQQMQDLGGCRAIVKDMGAVRKLIQKFDESFVKNPKTLELRRHELVYTDDYILNPKSDGYRSLHYVLEYRPSTLHLMDFAGHLIEVQIRTHLQHAWATAVEIVDTFTGQSLKSALKTNIGDKDWRRFFALASNMFAIEEASPQVPNMPDSYLACKRELRALASKTNVESVLSGLKTAVETVVSGRSRRGASTYVLRLDVKARRFYITEFDREDAAQLFLFEEERTFASNPTVQIVQVSVEKMQALRTAYPNYYLDTSMFNEALRRAIAPVRRKRKKQAA